MQTSKSQGQGVDSVYERIFSFVRGQVTTHLNVTFEKKKEKKKNPEGCEGEIPVDLCGGQG